MQHRIRAGAAALALAGVALFGGTAAAAVPPSDVQANNPQVSGDATSNTTAVFPTNKQNEPTIAVNPIDSNFLIAGANDEQRQPACGDGPVRGDTIESDCSFYPGVGTSGIYVSSDSGASWTNLGLLDDQPSWAGKGVISDGDPVIAYGPRPDATGRFSWANGTRAYYSSLATIVGVKGFEYIIVSYSDDNGHTWSAPVIGTTKTSSVDFNDKNWISVDTTPTSRYFGRVYLTWTEFRSATATGNGNEPMMVSVSTDGGLTFGAPNQLSPAGNNGTGNGRQGSSSTVGPDGTVYVAFEQGFNQVVTISRDGGQKWTRPAVIGPVTDIHDPIPGANFRTNSFPTIAADPRAGSTTVYASWSTRTAGGGRIVVATSTDRGVTWSAPVTVSGGEGYAFFQGLDVAPTGRVDLAWQSLTTVDGTKFGTGNASISTWAATKPAGGSWSAPKKVSTADSDPAVSAQNNLERQFWGDYNTLTSDADGAWVIFTDSRNGAGCPAVDGYQKFLIDSGIPVKGDMPDRIARREAGVNPALSAPGEKPAPLLDCTASPKPFGDTDARVVRF